MKIIIAGSGDTGTHLAKMLANEKQDVVLMSGSKDYLESIDATYNLMTSVGDPCSAKVLKDIGAGDADMFIGVTPVGTENMVSCQLAHQLGAATTIARVESQEFTIPVISKAFKDAGIDNMVYPEALVAEDVAQYINRNWVLCRHELHTGQLIFSGARILENSPLAGLKLKEIGASRQFHIVAIRRHRHTIIPGGEDAVLAGDVVYFTYAAKDEEVMRKSIGQSDHHVRHIVISGTGSLVDMILQRLSGVNHSISLLSSDLAFCREMAAKFPEVSVSRTNNGDIQTMIDEGIHQCDLFMALDKSTSENIVAAVTAKELGAKRTIAQIEELQFMGEAERLGIDKIVNKKLITSAVILRSIMGSQLHVRSMLSLDAVEVVEIEVAKGAAVTKGCIRQLNIPKDMTFGGLIHKGKAAIINGDTRLEEGDMVLVVFRTGTLEKVHKMFRSKFLF